MAEAPTKPISGAVSHCATQYVVKRAEHVSAVVEGGGLLVSTRLKAVVGRQPKSAASAVGETLTSSVSGHVVHLDSTGQRASCTDRVTGRDAQQQFKRATYTSIPAGVVHVVKIGRSRPGSSDRQRPGWCRRSSSAGRVLDFGLVNRRPAVCL